MIGDFHFLRPWWLLAILTAALLVWAVARQTDVKARWRDSIAPHLLDHLLIDRSAGRRLRPVHLVAAWIVLAALAAAGPTWQREQPPFVADTAPLVIAIDLSQTMDAIDVSPSRLERAKLKVHDILEQRKGARTAIFAYAGSAHMVLPLTEDAALVNTYVAALATNIMPTPGKDTTKALAAAEAGLEREQSPGTILFLTDGVEQPAFAAFKDHHGRNDIIVLGIGTAAGGPVKVAEGTYLTDSAGRRVSSKLDIEALKALQAETSVQVATATLDDGDVTWIVRHIQTAFEQKSAEGNTRWRDVGWWLTIPIALLGAFSFRKGLRVRWAGALFLLFVFTGPDGAQAADRDLLSLWLTQDQQGRLFFERGQYEQAATKFDDPAWQGIALYRARKFSEALDAFARLDTAEGEYNQGNALMQLNRPGDAVQAYQQALAKKPDWQDAKNNLALAQRLAAAEKQEDEDQQEQDPNEKPDQVQFDDKGKKGKEGLVEAATAQTAEMWMRNIQVTPTDLLRRKFAVEAQGASQ